MVCWAPGGFMSTVKHSVVGMRGYGHGCAMAGGEKLSAAVALVLEGELDCGERGERRRSSQGVGSRARWARGGLGGGERAPAISGGRRWGRRRGR